jgi:hypothetical protein
MLVNDWIDHDTLERRRRRQLINGLGKAAVFLLAVLIAALTFAGVRATQPDLTPPVPTPDLSIQFIFVETGPYVPFEGVTPVPTVTPLP